MYFTTRSAQDIFSSNVLYDFRRVDILHDLAAKMVEHMFELTDGRLWMAAHVRRGDCERVRQHESFDTKSVCLQLCDIIGQWKPRLKAIFSG